MSKKKAARPAAKAAEPKAKKHKENPIQRFAEEVEEHLIEGGEMATATTSAETNVVLAALGAIEGPPDTEQKTEQKMEQKTEKKRNASKRSKPRSKAR